MRIYKEHLTKAIPYTLQQQTFIRLSLCSPCLLYDSVSIHPLLATYQPSIAMVIWVLLYQAVQCICIERGLELHHNRPWQRFRHRLTFYCLTPHGHFKQPSLEKPPLLCECRGSRRSSDFNSINNIKKSLCLKNKQFVNNTQNS